MVKNFKSWFKSAGIRALKTFAQTFVATIGTGAAVLGDVNWLMVLSSAALAAILSIATSLAGLPEVKANEEEKLEDITNEVINTKETEKVEEVVETKKKTIKKEK